jgi:hypothetical protein
MERVPVQQVQEVIASFLISYLNLKQQTALYPNKQGVLFFAPAALLFSEIYFPVTIPVTTCCVSQKELKVSSNNLRLPAAYR